MEWLWLCLALVVGSGLIGGVFWWIDRRDAELNVRRFDLAVADIKRECLQREAEHQRRMREDPEYAAWQQSDEAHRQVRRVSLAILSAYGSADYDSDA